MNQEFTRQERQELDAALFNMKDELSWLVLHLRFIQDNYFDGRDVLGDIEKARKELANMQHHLELFNRARIRFEDTFRSLDEED